jgi:hypothetical protein
MRCRGANSLQFNQCFFCCPISPSKSRHIAKPHVKENNSSPTILWCDDHGSSHASSVWVPGGLGKNKNSLRKAPLIKWSSLSWLVYLLSQCSNFKLFFLGSARAKVSIGARARDPMKKSLNFFRGDHPLDKFHPNYDNIYALL